MILLDLQICTAGYSPTKWQRSLFPREYQYKIRNIFDGIDREFWYRRSPERKIGDKTIPADTKIITYVARGFESMRGADIFMRVANRICKARKDVVFVIVGSERVCYGGDLKHVQAKTFRDHVLTSDDYDMDRFIFTGHVPPDQLVDIFSLSDLHIYLTVPFVLSWSMMNALSCGCVVLGSETAPVQEMIRHEENGLLGGFYDIDGLTKQALRVIDDPKRFRPLGEAGAEMIESDYSLAKKLPEMLELYRETAST